ncbi:fructosamine kinase family protein [Kaarinaea lacus]
MQLMQQILRDLSAVRGETISLTARNSVSGGCINHAQRIETDHGAFFIKLNAASMLEMFEAEAEGLKELAVAGAIRVPEPYLTGIAAGQAYIVMENLEIAGGGNMYAFGEQLAEMHRYTAPRYGWHRDNTIGATLQPNRQSEDWMEFWREQRLGFQLELAGKNGASARMLDRGHTLMQVVHVLFNDYQPLASVLHGDLWSGNYAIQRSGEAVIFDPAVYFGDREADLAMTELFGGFSRDFYAGYNASWPLHSGYAVRKTFYNLYHILNHFNLFGGGYASQAERMIQQLLAELG